MYRFFLFLLVPFFTFSGIAQNQLFTIEEAVIGQWKELSPKNLQNIQWRGESNTFSFQDNQTIYEQSTTQNDSLILITLDELNEVLKSVELAALNYMPQIKWETSDEFHFYDANYWCAISLKLKKVIALIQLPDNTENTNLYYQKKAIAYTLENNLYLIDTLNIPISITQDANKNRVNGQSVSRNEFGIDGGIFWSPKGNSIAYYIKDESNVECYPLVDITSRQAELDTIKYPMAGMQSEHISLGIYTIETKNKVYIEASDTLSEKYLTNITWQPDEKCIYIQVLNREQNHMKLNKYSTSDGSLMGMLFEEKHENYVEPYHPLLFLKNKTNQFIYQTRTHGYNHAYLYNTEGKLIKQLSQGNWEITEIIHLSINNLYYLSTEENPTERHFYKIGLQNGKKQKLTTESGTHEITFNLNEKYFIDTYSNSHTPNNIGVKETTGKFLRTVLTAQNPLANYNMPRMEIGTLKAADGITDLYYRIIKPTNFDATKHYPAIVYVYGGPHLQLVENNWLGGARLWEYYMAQKGYVMLTVDNRGSANRGLNFENVIHRQCGVAEMQDQMEGIKLLKELAYVDMNRIGVHGWSYGGFMTTSLMVYYPDVFKVGVAGGPVIDWKYYEIMYGERYMDTPQENPEGYSSTSLIPRAKDLKGKLLMIHGAIDPVVVMQNSQVFVQECIKNRVPIDYFIYPRAEHNVRGFDRIHLMEKVTLYFDEYLK